MKAIRTVKIKFSGDERHYDVLCLRYLDALNWLSPIVFETKELNSGKLQKQFYGTVREKFQIPSQLTCALFRQVTATYKTAKSNKRWKLAVYRKPAIPVTYRRDFSRNRKGVTIFGKPVELIGPRIPDTGWKDSKIRRVRKQWYLILSHEIDIPEPKTKGCVVGVDFGVKRLMTSTNSNNPITFFFKGGRLNHRRSCIRRTRAAVQSVGTKSSRRLLGRMSGNEAAVTDALLHEASKKLVSYAVTVGAQRIVCEDLSNIRDSSLKKGKDLRSKVHRWPYAQGQFFVQYKAAAQGIEFELVDPRDTSRGCPRCGNVSASNRKGLHFKCGQCGHQDDADRNAAENVRLRSVVASHCVSTTGSTKSPEIYDPLIPERECSSNRHSGFGVGSGQTPRLKPWDT